ncbi:hypothetical protein E4U42_001298 [Claviceps africana]|uniref:RNA polymerase II transcription factor B subunit 2 n=1 Tax=Claviceps africana TaxID=83212 RepID=A0A8K0J006_9HYPO|nr:hypothetical protein E4U42_001298 [Claviceps africana]
MRFPDMVAGRVTRTSIRQAINFGITADQIISYMAAHAHEQMHRTAAATNKPILPPTVVDQIRLWQLENERMKTTGGFLFRDFDDHKEFADTARFAEEIGVLATKINGAHLEEGPSRRLTSCAASWSVETGRLDWWNCPWYLKRST